MKTRKPTRPGSGKVLSRFGLKTSLEMFNQDQANAKKKGLKTREHKIATLMANNAIANAAAEARRERRRAAV